MKKGTVMIAGVLLLLTSVAWGQSSGWLNPLRIKPLLSGNFGELRDSHFHSGLDYKTEGREGLPVICVKDGVLARVKVSATGYGNALYIEHADGTRRFTGTCNVLSPGWRRSFGICNTRKSHSLSTKI